MSESNRLIMKWGAIAPYEETNYDIHKVFEDFS